MTATRLTDPRTGYAVLPRVNLLPPEIAQRKRLRHARAGAGGAVLAAAAVVGGLTWLAGTSVHHAQADLDTAQAETTALQAKQRGYADVSDTYARVDAAEAQLTEAMGAEIQWSRFVNDLSLTIPNKVWLTAMTVQQQEQPVAPTQTGGTSAPTLGTVTFAGTAFDHDDVATWLESLAGEKGYTDVYFSNSAETLIGARRVVTFSSSVALTSDALSGRYTTPGGPR